MSWRIQPICNAPVYSDEVKAYARHIALAEALKQTTDLQDVDPNYIDRLGNKWRNHCLGMQRKLLIRFGEQLDDMLILAWRVNRFAHHYEAALIGRALEVSGAEPTECERKLSTAKGCETHYECGVLVAQHYAAIVENKELLRETSLTGYASTGEILEVLSFDYVLQAALCLPNDVQKALDLLADSVSANDLALQGDLHLHNYHRRKAERATNGKAGAQKRHAKMSELKSWTLEKHKMGSWKSANQAAAELMTDVLAHSREIGANLTKSNAQRTIAEWIRRSS